MFFVLTGSFAGCTSATESKGVDEVLAFYGGQVVYAKGMSSSTEDKVQGKFYELKLSGAADKIQQHFATFDLPASNCAYLFFHALSPAEKKNYAFIRINIEATGGSNTHEFATQDLARVEQAMSLVAPAVDDLRAGEYDRFLTRGNPLAASPQEWQKTKPTLVAVGRQYGPVKAFSLQGFETMQRNLDDGTHQLVRLAGVLVRGGQNTDFTFVVEPSASAQSKYLYGFSFSKE
ncbi:hypothetical protein GCM10028824_35760 [Hymenobacter segetis]